MIAVHDHFVLEENGRAAKPVHTRERTGPYQPSLIAFEIISGHEHLGVVKKGDINQFSVGRRRAGSMTVQGMFFLHRRGGHYFLPKNFSVRTIETKKDAGFRLWQRGNGENPI